MPHRKQLVIHTQQGLYCPQGDFYIDPIAQVNRAVISHGHSDHARVGANAYLCHKDSKAILQMRLGEKASIQTVEYGEYITINQVKIILYPAGHVLGSAQICLQYQGEIWVVSGDYKLASDPTCEPFEPVPCHVFISESTFALPIFRWDDNRVIFDSINHWWRQNNALNIPSIMGAYSLGKAQRLLACIDAHIGPIFLHGAVANLMTCYEQSGSLMPEWKRVDLRKGQIDYSGALIIAPPSALHSRWANRFKHANTALASGWMAIRGNRQRRGVQSGFVLSDHADWPGLISAVKQTGCDMVLLHHGYSEAFASYLNSVGFQAKTLSQGVPL